MDYALNRSMVHEDSLWRLFRDKVGPHMLATVDKLKYRTPMVVHEPLPPTNRALFVSQDSWIYGLYGGKHLTMDDIYAVSPFDEPFYKVSVLPCASIQELDRRMNNDLSNVYLNQVPAWILSEHKGDPDSPDCELYVNRFGMQRVFDGLREMTQANGEPDVDFMGYSWKSNISTTNVWMHYIQDEWQCPSGWGLLRESFENGDPVAVGVTVSMGVLIALLTGVCCWLRGRRKNGSLVSYDGVVAVESAAPLPSDNHLDEGNRVSRRRK